jgi:hypothetical protein
MCPKQRTARAMHNDVKMIAMENVLRACRIVRHRLPVFRRKSEGEIHHA